MERIFIIDKDYDRIIKDAIRDQVVLNDTELLRASERAAIEEMMSYLNVRFDVTNMFPALHQWHTNDLYFPGDYREHRGAFYRAILPTDTNPDPNRGIEPAGTSISPNGETGKGYYWTDHTFPNIKDWDAAELVPVGAYRVSATTKKFYRCEVEHTGQNPEEAANIYDPDAETGYWTADDPRNAKLVEICCELALYKAHARISPDQIPELRVQHHDMAISWLKGTASGKNSPMLPKVSTEEQNNNAVQFGSITKRTYTY